MTERELEVAVPALRPSPSRSVLAVMLVGFVVVLASLLALAIHAYFAPPPTFR